eukprot:389555_1
MAIRTGRNQKKRKTRNYEKDEVPNKKKRKTHSPRKGIFNGLSFVLSGGFSQNQTQIKSLITRNGGVVTPTTTDKTSYVLVKQKGAKLTAKKCTDAIKLKIKIISEPYIHNCIKKNKKLNDNNYIQYDEKFMKHKKDKSEEWMLNWFKQPELMNIINERDDIYYECNKGCKFNQITQQKLVDLQASLMKENYNKSKNIPWNETKRKEETKQSWVFILWKDVKHTELIGYLQFRMDWDNILYSKRFECYIYQLGIKHEYQKKGSQWGTATVFKTLDNKCFLLSTIHNIRKKIKKCKKCMK